MEDEFRRVELKIEISMKCPDAGWNSLTFLGFQKVCNYIPSICHISDKGSSKSYENYIL